MQKTQKEMIYERYIGNRHLTEEQLINSLLNDQEITLPEGMIKTCIKEIKEIEEDTDRTKNEIMFGIELEFEGYDTDVRSSLIEDKKDDGSVKGDGLEINLYPVLMNKTDIDEFKKKAEKMMLSAIKNSCKVGPSAGMHIHLSSDTINQREGRIIEEVFVKVFCNSEMDKFWDDTKEKKYIYDDYENEYIDVTDEDPENIEILENDYDGSVIEVKGKELLRTKNEDLMSDKIKMNLEWIKFLYSVCERDGFEEYGICRDGTRGYTDHETVELRAWRTTLDYRKLTARAKIAAFWIYNVCKNKRLIEHGFITEKTVDIWEDLQKDKEALDAYKYLAFNCDNKYNIGYTREELEKKLYTEKEIANAITDRSKLIKKSLFCYPETQVKELFKNV